MTLQTIQLENYQFLSGFYAFDYTQQKKKRNQNMQQVAFL